MKQTPKILEVQEPVYLNPFNPDYGIDGRKNHHEEGEKKEEKFSEKRLMFKFKCFLPKIHIIEKLLV